MNNVSLSIDILDDQTPELDEKFRIVLYNVSGRNERLRNGAVSHNFPFVELTDLLIYWIGHPLLRKCVSF